MIGNKKIIALLVASLCCQLAIAEESVDNKTIELESIVVKGILPEKLESVPGSYSIVDEKELEARRPFSIKEALSSVPGLNIIQNEDPLGLAQNIGLRGMDPRRSARTLLMEDGLPLYLAPYGDPSSHYIPNVRASAAHRGGERLRPSIVWAANCRRYD